jgi:hypothetical protein|tara:strand:+ start:549 stop:1205 length:657 start_codon:yes stop_codon:yes gene_type:complete
MDILINKLLEYGTVGILIIGLVVLIPLLPKYLDALDYIRKTKEKAIIDAIKDNNLSASSQKILNQKRETDLYFRNLGIRADYYLIKNLNNLIEHSQGAITTRTIKSAIIHLSSNKDGLVIKIERLDIWIKRIFGLFFWLFIFITIIMIFFIVYTIEGIFLNPTIENIIVFTKYLIYFLAGAVGAVAFLKGRIEVESAEKIIDYLNNNTDIKATIRDSR